MEALSRLKVFPLPTAVLLPGAGLPLHVFEPRYRELVRDALASDRVLGVAMLTPGWEANYTGRPPLRPVFGLGVIEEDEALADGRFNILLRGRARMRIVGEHPPDKPYREVSAELVAARASEDPGLLDPLRRTILELSPSLLPGLASELSHAAARLEDAGALCDLAAAALIEDARALQAVLEAADVGERVRRVIAEIGQLLLSSGKRKDQLLS